MPTSMKPFSHWILALAALLAVATYVGARPGPQEPTGKPARKLDRPQGKKPGLIGRGEKQGALKKLLPTLETSLAEGITLAEKACGGKAFTASVEVRQELPVIQVSLFAADKLTLASVDPKTKKVTIAGKPSEEPPAGDTADGESGD